MKIPFPVKFFYLLAMLLVGGVYGSISAQQFVWQAGVHSFFDNDEFQGSEVRTSQTMAGVHVAPQVGVSWHKRHLAFVGIDAMHEFGSVDAVGYYDPIAYYRFDGNPFRFYMGAFPRREVLIRYPRMFFQDSILNYRPVVNGLFWEYYNNDSYLNVWLDWTGRQSTTVHEAFFMGWSGQYKPGVFYARMFGYMYHFAALKDPVVEEGLHDNGLVLASLGLDFARKTGFEKLEINAGWTAGLERDRSLSDWQVGHGFLSELKVEYKGLGLFNTLYMGQRQQVYFQDHGNALYWGDRMYRLTEYNRTDFYVRFFKTEVVNLKLALSFHFAEGSVFNEQALYASFDLSNLERKSHRKPYEYLWSNWFER